MLSAGAIDSHRHVFLSHCMGEKIIVNSVVGSVLQMKPISRETVGKIAVVVTEKVKQVYIITILALAHFFHQVVINNYIVPAQTVAFFGIGAVYRGHRHYVNFCMGLGLSYQIN